jgi:hypothetical protein
MDARKTILSALLVLFIALTAQAFSRQSAAIPGEELSRDGDETTAVQMAGTFAVEMTSTGIGTIQIKRSEDKSTWIVVETYTNSSAADRREYMYESFGDGTLAFDKAWYKAVLSGNPSSGSFRVRLVQ